MVTSHQIVPQLTMSQNLQQVMSIPMMMLQHQPLLLGNQQIITQQLPQQLPSQQHPPPQQQPPKQ